MAGNANLGAAKDAKNDEFYTQCYATCLSVDPAIAWLCF